MLNYGHVGEEPSMRLCDVNFVAQSSPVISTPDAIVQPPVSVA